MYDNYPSISGSSRLGALPSILLLVVSFLGCNTTLAAKDDIRENSVREVFDLYRIKMLSYCEDYNWTDRLDIQEYLLTSQEIDFSSDIPGLDLYQLTASDYFHFLSQEKVKITYAKDYDLEICSITPPVYGVRVKKEVSTKAGTLYQYEEYIEVHLDNQNEARIHAIASNRFSAYEDIECLKKGQESTVAEIPTQGQADCSSFTAAELAKKEGRVAAAISFYEQALDCREKTEYINEQLELLRNRSSISSLLAKGRSAYASGNLKVAINVYESLLSMDLRQQLTEQEERLVREGLATIRRDLAFSELVSAGDHHFSKRSYQKAITAYRKAEAIRPSDVSIKNKIKSANQYLQGEYRKNAKREIDYTLAKLKRDYRYDDTALLTLMKYSDTGWLSGEALFLLMQMVDGISAKARKQLRFSKRDVCVKTKLLMRQVAASSYNSAAFSEFRKYHLTERSRTCE